MTNLVWFSLI